MDTGLKRTAADALKLHDWKNPKTLAAVAGMIVSGLRSARSVSTGEIDEALSANPNLESICADIVPKLKSTTPMTEAVLGYVYWRLDQVSADHASLFFNSLSSLIGFPAGSPILALHRRLTSHDQGTRGNNYRREAIAYVFTAWNAWVRGEKRSIIKIVRSDDGRLAIPDPVSPRPALAPASGGTA